MHPVLSFPPTFFINGAGLLVAIFTPFLPSSLRFLFIYPGTFDSPTPWQDGWRELEKLYNKGAVRAIGVSNFSEDLLQELLQMATVMPAAVQNWMDPFHQDRAVRALCSKHGERASMVGTARPARDTWLNCWHCLQGVVPSILYLSSFVDAVPNVMATAEV